MAKRTTTEDFDVSDLTPTKIAKVHGVVVGEVSPVKESKKNSTCKYFQGQLSDGKKTVRMISFEPKLRQDLQKAKETQQEIALDNVCVQQNKLHQDTLEIVIGSRSSVTKSPKKFQISDNALNEFSISNVSTIEEIRELTVNQHIDIVGKVFDIQPTEKLTSKSGDKKLNKQDLTLGDCTACCRCVAWENHIGVLEEDRSYRFNNVTVRSFNGVKYLSLSEASTITAIDDIGEIVEEYPNEGQTLKVVEAEIHGVLNIEEYKSCMSCQAKVVEVNMGIGQCGKCGMKMKITRCENSTVARLLLTDTDDNKHKVTAFSKVIADIVKDSSGLDTSEKLLNNTKKIKFTLKQDIVSAVSFFTSS